MEFADLIVKMTQAIVRGDGDEAAACFTEAGVYHDVFYGPFPKADIPRMVSDHFHRDAERFRWDIHDPVSDGVIGYARYVFSYDGKIAGSEGRRGVFEGVSVCRLADGLISSYTEVANTSTGLRLLGFPPERLARIVDRQADELLGRDEAAAHRGAVAQAGR
jgi:ketosteroid isomerase-like protein